MLWPGSTCSPRPSVVFQMVFVQCIHMVQHYALHLLTSCSCSPFPLILTALAWCLRCCAYPPEGLSPLPITLQLFVASKLFFPSRKLVRQLCYHSTGIRDTFTFLKLIKFILWQFHAYNFLWRQHLYSVYFMATTTHRNLLIVKWFIHAKD